MTALGSVLLGAGTLLGFLAAVGVARFPSALARMHASTKAASLGFILVVVGAAALARSPGAAGIAVLVAAFQFLTAPVSGHLLGRAATLAGAHGDLLVDDFSGRRAPLPEPPSGETVFSTSRVAGTALLWVLLWRDAAVGTFAAGLIVGLTVEAVGRRRTVARIRPLPALRFLVFYVGQVAVSNARLAWEVATPWHDEIAEAIVRCPLETLSPPVAILVANSVTFSPGTLTVELTEEPELVLYVHVLRFRDREETRAEIRALEERATAVFRPDVTRRG